jgi:MFS family permease
LFDGFFSAASDNIILTYIVLYVLALGATRAQIGLMSALSSLSAALLLLPGAMMAESWKSRKLLVVITGGGFARLAILFLVFVPFFVNGELAIILAMALSITRDSLNNLAMPGWISLTADIIPLSWRGRYFASRNIAMGISGMLATILVGEVITRSGVPAGYQIAMGIAFTLGLFSTFSFSRIIEAPPPAPVQKLNFLTLQNLLRDQRSHPGFMLLCATAALWNFSLNIAGPFFNVYLVENLKATASAVGIVTIVTSISSLFVQRFFGVLTDRWGPRQVQLITGLLIPILPFSWVFVRSPWHVIPINLLSGILWAGYSLASFNFLLAFTPEDQRARYSALYQLIVTLSLSAGAVLGGQIATHFGYAAIFICSGVGRLSAAILFARYVPQPEDAFKIPNPKPVKI